MDVGGVTYFFVIFAHRGSPMEAQRSVKPWTQEAHHFRHSEGCVSTPWNPQGGAGQSIVVTPAEPTGGFFGRLWLPLNDVRWESAQQGSAVQWTRRPTIFVIQRGASAPRGIPYGGAEQYIVVFSLEPLTRALEYTPPRPACFPSALRRSISAAR